MKIVNWSSSIENNQSYVEKSGLCRRYEVFTVIFEVNSAK